MNGKDGRGCPESPDLVDRELATCSQVETQANICQVWRALRAELKIYIYEIPQNVKCFLNTTMWA